MSGGTPLSGDPIDSAGPVKETLVMLFYGWGFNWYRKENRLRADDLLIRSKVSGYLSDARASLASLESAYRARYLPPPSREHPLPDPAAMTQARLLYEAGQKTGAVEAQVRTAPVPENDKVWQRYRAEKETLQRLSLLDAEMVDAAVSLAGRLAAARLEDVATGGLLAQVGSELEQVSGTLRRRAELLRISG